MNSFNLEYLNLHENTIRLFRVRTCFFLCVLKFKQSQVCSYKNVFFKLSQESINIVFIPAIFCLSSKI